MEAPESAVEAPYSPDAPWNDGRQRRWVGDRHNDVEKIPLKRLPKDHPDFPHSRTGFQYGCRCEVCLAGQREYMAEYRRRTGVTKPTTEYIPRAQRMSQTGTRSCYANCRKRPEGPHPECRQAHNEYQSAYGKWKRGTGPHPGHDRWVEEVLSA